MATDFQEMFSEGYRARQEGRLANSRAIFIDAVRKAAEEGAESSLAEALCGLAQAENDIGNCLAARLHYSGAAALYRRVGPPVRLAFAIRHEADLLRQEQQPSEAEPLYREAESIYRDGGKDNTLDLANTLRGLALNTDAGAGSAKARLLWKEARELYASRGVQAGVAECDAKLAN